MIVSVAVGMHVRSVAEVRCPATQQRVEPVTHFGPREEVARGQYLSDPGPEPPHALLGWSCSQVPFPRPAGVIRSKPVAKEVEVLRTGIYQLGLICRTRRRIGARRPPLIRWTVRGSAT